MVALVCALLMTGFVWPTVAPEALPPVTVRWEDPAQTEVFVVEGARYRCRVATHPARILSLHVDGKNLLGPDGISLGVIDGAGSRWTPAPRGVIPTWSVWRRQWVPATNARARMNIWSAGPYYWDAHLLDIPLVRAGSDAPPLRGEIVFHAHPDHLRIELRVDPAAGQAAPPTAFLDVDGAAVLEAARQKRPLAALKSAGAAVGVLGVAGASFGPGERDWTAPLAPGRNSAHWVVRPLAAGVAVADAFAEEFDPLPAKAVTVTGGRWLGYDAPSGLYEIAAESGNPAAFSFEESFTNPGRHLAADLRLKNGARPRHLLIKSRTGIGNLEAAALTDPYGFPLPVPVQVSKNFAGEREEPDDTAFGDAYFPLSLSPGEDRAFRLLHLNQNWGRHPLKQVSSIRFFNVYWHLSTGASETTCFTHNWMEIGRSGILHVPDFRPLSGPFWPGQPQHHCLQWPGFLQYNDRKGRLVYERTDFESISPNLARFTMRFHTSDDAATARLSVMEIPQRDEARTFVRLRYDWQKAVTIEGDARLNFRWLSVFEKRLPETLLWTDAAETTRTLPVTATDAPLLRGEPLAARSPFVASHARDRKIAQEQEKGDADADNYHCLVLVRGFRARLGGRDFDRAAVSAQFGERDGSYWLTVPAQTLILQPGDFVEADVMLMPHAEPTPPAVKPERERSERFGAGIPVLEEVALGTKLSDFPAVVRAKDEAALVTMTGGFDYMPLIVEGFSGWGVPLLWRGTVWQDPQVHGGDGYQVEPDGRGGYRFVLVYPIRKGQKHRLLVTRADCTTGIARLREVNGAVVMEAPKSGRFSLKAPVLFGPGRNAVAAGSPVVAFSGSGMAVRSVPVTVSIAAGHATVDVDARGTEVTVQGALAAVTFVNRVRGGTYAVTVNGKTARVVAADGTVPVQTTEPESTILCIRVRAPGQEGGP